MHRFDVKKNNYKTKYEMIFFYKYDILIFNIFFKCIKFKLINSILILSKKVNIYI